MNKVLIIVIVFALAVFVLFFYGVSLLVFLLGSSTPPPDKRCEQYKAQVSALCNAQLQTRCEETVDIDKDMPGDECAWDLANEKCVLKEDLDWAKSDWC